MDTNTISRRIMWPDAVEVAKNAPGDYTVDGRHVWRSDSGAGRGSWFIADGACGPFCLLRDAIEWIAEGGW